MRNSPRNEEAAQELARSRAGEPDLKGETGSDCVGGRGHTCDIEPKFPHVLKWVMIARRT